jgi:hypothetical protein
MSQGTRPLPTWLRPYWENKKQETAHHVTAAVAKLTVEGMPVTFSSIRETVRILYGKALSANTIRRNELAYETYLQHRRPAKTRTRSSTSLKALYQATTPEHRPSLYAKVGRLRRESKDSLIGRLIQAEARVRQQVHDETKLREEVMQVNLRLLAFQKPDRFGASH